MAITDYIEIEYIEGVTGAYIEIPYADANLTNRNVSISAVCTCPIDTNNRYAIWGAEGSANKYSFGMDQAGTSYIWHYGAKTATLSPSTPVLCTLENQRKLYVYQTVAASNVNYIVNIYPANRHSSGTSARAESGENLQNRSMYILASHNTSGTTASWYANGCRLYYMDAYNYATDTDLLKLYPIRDPNTGQVGLYNAINDKAYFSGSTTNFVAGPDLHGSSKMWIRSSGSWLFGTPYVKQSGSWVQGTPYIRQSGSWTKGS